MARPLYRLLRAPVSSEFLHNNISFRFLLARQIRLPESQAFDSVQGRFEGNLVAPLLHL